MSTNPETLTTAVTVSGMTCEHCVASVTEEVGEIDGVTAVAVDLGSGRVTITSERPIEAEAIAAAIDGAGYQLAP